MGRAGVADFLGRQAGPRSDVVEVWHPEAVDASCLLSGIPSFASPSPQLGAQLDRNGLRPARLLETKDGLVCMMSEMGVIDVPESEIIVKDRLGVPQRCVECFPVLT